jgi:hypothetical protein
MTQTSKIPRLCRDVFARYGGNDAWNVSAHYVYRKIFFSLKACMSAKCCWQIPSFVTFRGYVIPKLYHVTANDAWNVSAHYVYRKIFFSLKACMSAKCCWQIPSFVTFRGYVIPKLYHVTEMTRLPDIYQKKTTKFPTLLLYTKSSKNEGRIQTKVKNSYIYTNNIVPELKRCAWQSASTGPLSPRFSSKGHRPHRLFVPTLHTEIQSEPNTLPRHVQTSISFSQHTQLIQTDSIAPTGASKNIRELSIIGLLTYRLVDHQEIQNVKVAKLCRSRSLFIG